MTREEQIKEAARQRADQYSRPVDWSRIYYGFIDGAKWAYSHPQWVPVEKVLPKEKQKVLVYMPADERCDHEYVCEALYNYAWHKWEDADEPIELEGVTHWMPLPQLPQGKEK